MLSKEETPVLAGTVPAFEIFLTKLETLAKVKPKLKDCIEEGLTFAKKYYRSMDDTGAYVVAMCMSYDLCFVLKQPLKLSFDQSSILPSAFLGFVKIGRKIMQKVL
jgi:hypothetical protein